MAREGLPGDRIDHLTGRPISSDDSEREDFASTPELEPEPDPADFEVPPGADSEAKDPRQGYAFSPLVTQRCCIYIDNDEDYQRASQILVKMGAAREPTISASEAEWINRWATRIALIAAVLVALYVWENWKR